MAENIAEMLRKKPPLAVRSLRGCLTTAPLKMKAGPREDRAWGSLSSEGKPSGKREGPHPWTRPSGLHTWVCSTEDHSRLGVRTTHRSLTGGGATGVTGSDWVQEGERQRPQGNPRLAPGCQPLTSGLGWPATSKTPFIKHGTKTRNTYVGKFPTKDLR